MASYGDLLRDPRWQRRRLEIMQRDGFACRVCADKETTLNVHHQFYVGRLNPWEYSDLQLITLCETCHKKNTALIEQLKRALSLLPPSRLERVVGYTEALAETFGATDSAEVLRGSAEVWGITVEDIVGPGWLCDAGPEE